jgi:hypothetical protein
MPRQKRGISAQSETRDGGPVTLRASRLDQGSSAGAVMRVFRLMQTLVRLQHDAVSAKMTQ